MPHFDGRGFRIHYVEEGSGPAVVFAHGAAADHTMYAAQFEDLPDRYRCIAWDMRGHGRSAMPDAPWTMQDIVVDLIAFIEGVNAAPCHLVGHSIAANAALRLAIQREDLLRSLVLIGANAAAEDGGTKELLRTFVAEVERNGGASEDQASAIASFQFADAFRAERADAVEVFANGVGKMSGEAIAAVLNCAIDRDPLVDRLGEVRVPTLVIHGDEDAIPVARGDEIAEGIGSAESVRVPGAGHMPPLEAPDVVNEALAGFFARVKR